MIVNFRTCGINRGTRKLIWTPTLIKKNDIKDLAVLEKINLQCKK